MTIYITEPPREQGNAKDRNSRNDVTSWLEMVKIKTQEVSNANFRKTDVRLKPKTFQIYPNLNRVPTDP